jgi:hypothetical protein
MRLPNSCEILTSHFLVLALAQESGNVQAHYNMGYSYIIGSYLASRVISYAIHIGLNVSQGDLESTHANFREAPLAQRHVAT